MTRSTPILTFRLDGRHYGLPLNQVVRVIPAIDCAPLPEAPAAVVGICNLRGEILPVFNLRCKFGLPERATSITDQFIIAHTCRRTVAVVVDAAGGVIEPAVEQLIRVENVLEQLDKISGVVRLSDGLLLIHDLDTFLSSNQEIELERALIQKADQNEQDSRSSTALA